MNKGNVLATMLGVLLAPSFGFGQTPSIFQADKFKKEAVIIERTINDIANATSPGYGLLQPTKSAYVDGYGAVFTLEVAFEPPRSPFNSSKSPEEIRILVGQRRKQIRERLSEMIKEKAATLGSLSPTESMAIVIYLVNSNPADLPDLPSSIVISLKRQDALDLQAGKITAADLSSKVQIREMR